MKIRRSRPAHRLAAALLAAAAVVCANGQAATVTANVTVQATLTSACEITSAPTNVTFAYQSFQASTANSTAGSGAFTVRCTANLPYTLSISPTTGTVLGLPYTLSVPGTSYSGLAAGRVHSNSATNGITGTINSGQAGDWTGCATGPATCTATSATTHVLTINY